MPAKLTQVQLRRHAGGKALRWLWLPVAHVLIRPRSTRRYRRLRRRYIGGMCEEPYRLITVIASLRDIKKLFKIIHKEKTKETYV